MTNKDKVKLFKKLMETLFSLLEPCDTMQSGGGQMNAFTKYIKRARNEAGLTQEQVAEHMGVSKVAVQNWEKTGGIRRERLKKLSELYNVPIGELSAALDTDDEEGDNWPDFLFEYKDAERNILNLEENNSIVSTLRLNLKQQELFGIMCIYDAEYLQNESIGCHDKEDFEECLKKVPFEYINKVGSIQFMNICDGLYKVLKYVKSDFLLKILKLDPDRQFNLRRLSKEQICEFIDGGFKEMGIDAELDAMNVEAFCFNISMSKARLILPLLEKNSFRFNGNTSGAELMEDTPDDVVKVIAKACDLDYEKRWNGLQYGRGFIAGIIGDNLKYVTEWDYDNYDAGHEVASLSINETGRKLLEWFREK